ncbi:MAG: aminotransferase class I and II, partial [Paramuribaculum sp.]|nr:aminotransferase class I and II [Paramuribaculum sp.]
FPYIPTHALLPHASELRRADKLMRQAITPRTLSRIVALIPDEWLTEEGSDITPAERRATYERFLHERLAKSKIFVDKAIEER